MDNTSKRVKSNAKTFTDIKVAQPRNEIVNRKPSAVKSDKPPEQEKAKANPIKKSPGATTENVGNASSSKAPIKDMRTAVVTACNVEIARTRFLSLIGVERRGEPFKRYTIKDEKAADRIAKDFAERL